jgi:hypothetical protein
MCVVRYPAFAVLSFSSSAVVIFCLLVLCSTSTHLRCLQSRLSLPPTSSTTLASVSIAPPCCPFLPTFLTLLPPLRPNFLRLAAILLLAAYLFLFFFFVMCLFYLSHYFFLLRVCFVAGGPFTKQGVAPLKTRVSLFLLNRCLIVFLYWLPLFCLAALFLGPSFFLIFLLSLFEGTFVPSFLVNLCLSLQCFLCLCTFPRILLRFVSLSVNNFLYIYV